MQRYVAALNEFRHYRNLTEAEKQLVIKSILERPYMDLRCDWAFKHIMQDMNKLKLLLEDFIPEDIDSVEPLPNELDRFRPDDKNIIMDVLCKTAHGDSFIVEMQKKKKLSFKNRMFYYGASMASRQLKSSESYRKLRPVYVICFMDFTLEHISEQLVYRYSLKELSSGESYGKQLSIYLCELPRLQQNNLQKMDRVEKWFFILKNLCNFAGKPEDIGERYAPIARAARTHSLPDEDQLNYMRAMISEEERLDMGGAYFEDGYKKGREEAILDTAKRLLSLGVTVETIAKATGLDSDTLSKLQ